MKRPPVVVSACSSAEYGHVPASAIPVTEEYPLNPLHPYGISKVCLDLWRASIFWISKFPQSISGSSIPPGRARRMTRLQISFSQLVAIKKGLQTPVIEVGNLKPRRAFLDVNDTVRAFYLAAMKGKLGESYNVCATRTHQDERALAAGDPPFRCEGRGSPCARLMRPSDEKIIFGSTQKIRKDMGWKPLRTIDQTLQSMLDYWEQCSLNDASADRIAMRCL